jgi:hypothetical protein
MRTASHSTYTILSVFFFGAGCLHSFMNVIVAATSASFFPIVAVNNFGGMLTREREQ